MKFGRKSKSDNFFKQKQEKTALQVQVSAGATSSTHDKQLDGYFFKRSRWVRSFAKMAGLHFGICQAQKDEQADSLTQVSEEQANTTGGREVFCEGPLVAH